MKKEINFSEIWERVRSKTKLKTLTDLAELVGTTQQFVSRKKKKNEFPANWAFIIAQQNGLSTDWIMTGQDQKRPSENIKRKYEILDEAEEWLNEEVRKNPDRKIWFEVELLDAFPKFMEWRRKRAEEKDGEDEYPASKVA